MRSRDPHELTDREREVLALLRRDFTNEQIAERLGISLDGAKYHVSQILSKLGVATRAEAAALALGERRRWWAGWPLWARIAGAATVVAAIGVLAAVVWNATRANEAVEEIREQRISPSVVASPTIAPAPTFAPPPPLVAPFGPDVIGTYEDVNDFRSFAQRIDAAVQAGDVQFFLDNTRFEDFPCDRGGFPARPRACGHEFNDAVISAVVIGIMQSDDFGIDRLEYEAFLRGFFDSSPANSDPYGVGSARLYAYGIHSQRSAAASRGGDQVDAVGTAISAQFPSGTVFESPRRALLVFHTILDGEQWVIDWLSYGGDPFSTALYLDPGGSGASIDTGGPLWAFWQRWESTPTP